jgi:hypothetical protein
VKERKREKDKEHERKLESEVCQREENEKGLAASSSACEMCGQTLSRPVVHSVLVDFLLSFVCLLIRLYASLLEGPSACLPACLPDSARLWMCPRVCV